MDEKKAIFKMLRQMADAITKTMGRNCEVAVHDFADLTKSLVYLAGNVTGRKVGAPITDLVIKALHRKGKKIKDRYNYKTTTRDGRSIKSSTIFIRDSAGDVIGAFCINIDTTELLNASHVIEEIVKTVDLNAHDDRETFAATVGETIEALFEQAVAIVGKQPATMVTAEKIRLVEVLESKGAFQIKGAVDQVAILVGVSKYTIYNYLQKVRAAQAINKF